MPVLRWAGSPDARARRSHKCGRAEEFGRFSVCECERTGGVSANEKGFFGGADGNVFAAAKKIRLDAKVCGDIDRRARAGPSEESRRGDCRGEISRAAARPAVGCERFAGDEGLPHDVGSGWLRESDD